MRQQFEEEKAQQQPEEPDYTNPRQFMYKGITDYAKTVPQRLQRSSAEFQRLQNEK